MKTPPKQYANLKLELSKFEIQTFDFQNKLYHRLANIKLILKHHQNESLNFAQLTSSALKSLRSPCSYSLRSLPFN